MKTASRVVLGVVVLLGALWLAFVRAPPPRAVCDHMIEVTVTEATRSGMSPDSQQAIIDRIRGGCVQHKLDLIQLRGRIAYAKFARCVANSDSVAEFSRC